MSNYQSYEGFQGQAGPTEGTANQTPIPAQSGDQTGPIDTTQVGFPVGNSDEQGTGAPGSDLKTTLW